MKRILSRLGLLMFLPAGLMADDLVWSGTNGNTWDTNNTVNWNYAGTPVTFLTGDTVTFSDASSNGTVTLVGTLQPGSVTVNNANTPYTFSGTGQISGATGLLKSGTGTLTISNTNSYTGGTVISAGTILLTTSNALSTSGSTTLGDVNTGTNNVALLLSISSTGKLTFSRPITVSNLGSGTATIGDTGAGSGLATISSPLTLNRDTSFQSSTSGTLSLTGTFTGNGNAIICGGGVTSLAAITSGSGINGWNGNLSVTGNSLLLQGTNSIFNPSVYSNRTVSVAAGSGFAAASGTLAALTGSGNVGGASSFASLGVGGSNSSSTFNGTIGGGTVAGYALNASLNLIKTGTGVFTLAGSNTYTGTTTVSKGTLALSGSGSIASTPLIIVSPGAVLDVSGLSSGAFSLGSSQSLQAGRTSGFANDVIGSLASSGTLNIAGSGTAGTLTISGNLALNGGTVRFDLANVTTAGTHVNDLISLGGSLSLSGTTTIIPNLLNGSLASGTYTLISGGSALTGGNASDLAWGGSLNRQSVTFNTSTNPGMVYMTVSGAAANLIWLGTNGNTWDTNSTTNWNDNGMPDVFLAGDNVTFSDASSNGTVTLSGTLQPGSATINNENTAYTFGGSGQISGVTGLLKSGTGTLTISNTNSYTGGTVISAGTIVLNSSGALGTSGTTTLGDVNTGANNVALLLSVSSTAGSSYALPIVVSDLGTGTATLGRTGAGSGPATISSPLTLNRDATFQSATSGTLSVTGSFVGSGNAIFSGGGVTSVASTSGSFGGWSGSVSVTGNSMLLAGTNANSSATVFTNRTVDVAAGSGFATVSGTLGALTGSGNVGGASSFASLGVGGSNSSSTFNGTIGGGTVAGYALNPSLNLIKTGSGVFTLTGNNTYTGTTTVSQGTLALSGNGSIGNTPSVLVSPGAVLNVSALNSGAFALGSNQTLQAGRTSGFANDVIGNLASSGTLNIAGSGTAGTLTIGGNLALNGGTMLFDFANVTTAGAHVNDLITLGGSLSLGGTTTIMPNLLNSALTSGTYTLISGGTALTSGNASDFAWGGSLNRQSVTFNTTTTPGTVYMTVCGAAANLVWLGTNGNTWDTNNTTNWNNNGTQDVFLVGDSVTFNDASSNGDVTLSGTIQPGSTTVNNTSTAYTFSGSGQISGAASLLKSGTGTLTISNTNSYTGGTVISAGTVVLSTSNALGTGGTTTLGDGNTGANNVTLLLSVPSTGKASFSRPIVVSNLGSGAATIGDTGPGNGLATISSPLTLNKDATFQSATSGTLSVTGAFVGNGNAIFSGGGVTSLASTSGSGATAWNGSLSVTGNSLLLSSTAYLEPVRKAGNLESHIGCPGRQTTTYGRRADAA